MSNEGRKKDDIAIIGMACRFPGAKDYNHYWENLKNSVNSIREIPADRWDTHLYYSTDAEKPDTSVSKWAGLLDDIFSFDNQFFHISPREAQNMDPQQRLLLEEAWHCIEDAGISVESLRKHITSVYVGVMAIDYQHRLAHSNEPTDSYACIGNYEGILANRLSFYLGLNGESKSIDTACSSSLVALHDAKRSLNIGESQYAFAAGVSIICHPWKYISFSKSRMLSPDGQCKTFDSAADGYVPGEGIGVLLLTSLENALEKGHRIHGILKGTAVNHTGKSVSITAPRVEAQRDVIQAAQKSAEIRPEQITYIEAHGTGTSLGDPIEVEGLIQAFHSQKTHYCALGSVKTNIGHLEAAAGVAGVIKVLLMLKHGQLVPTLNVHTLNPIIDFEHSPFYLSFQTAPWPKINDENRIAGISSFGFGGANAHVILEEFTDRKDLRDASGDYSQFPFALTAKSSESLDALVNLWENYSRSEMFFQQSIADIAHTQIHGRESFSHRIAFMMESKSDLFLKLTEAKKDVGVVDGKISTGALILTECENLSPAQWKMLCTHYPALDKISSSCFEILEDLKYGSWVRCWAKGDIKSAHALVFQFIILYSLGKWLLDNGLVPFLITGTGPGVLAAAALTGLLDLVTALRIVLKEKKISLGYKTPLWPFSVHFLSNVIEPFSISTDYCLRLRQGLALDDSAFFCFLEKSRLLIKNQFTFKQYINAWRDFLLRVNIDIIKILEADEPLVLSYNQKIILLVAIATSFKKLNEKWNLTEKIKINNVAIAEILDLILDGCLSYGMAVDLVNLETPVTHLDLICQKLIEEREHLNKSKPYLILRQNTKLFASITLDQWQNSLLKSDANEIKNEWIQDKLCNIQIGSLFLKTDKTLVKLRHFVFPSLQKFILKLWQRGAIFKLNTALLPLAGNTVSLPLYPFSKKTFMISSAPITAQKSNQPFSEFFEVSLSDIQDHKINDKVIFPAAGYLNIISNSLKKISPNLILKNLLFPRPLILDSQNQKVTIEFELDKEDGFQIHLLEDRGAVFAQGQLDRGSLSKFNINIQEIKNQFGEVEFYSDFYVALKKWGYDYGSSYQVVEWAKANGKNALARIKNISGQLNNMVFSFPILDAGFQIAVFLELSHNFDDSVFPLGISNFRIYQSFPSHFFVYVTQESKSSKYHIQYLNSDGEVLVELDGFILKAQKKNTSSSLAYYYAQLEDRPLSRQMNVSEESSVILFDDDDSRVSSLRNIFSSLGMNLYQFKSRDIDLRNPRFQILLEGLFRKNIKPNYFVNFLANEAHDISQVLDSGVMLFFGLVQSLSLSKIRGSIRILHVSLHHENDPLFPVEKMALGFLRTLRTENPGFICKFLNLDSVDLNIVKDELLSDFDSDFVSYRNGIRQVEAYLPIQPLQNMPVLRKHGVYLITGGAGGIGLFLARFLAEKYQAKLLLCGRNSINADIERYLTELKSLGSEAVYRVADVGSRPNAIDLISVALEKFGQLNGIFHCAGIIDDDFIIKKNSKIFTSVLEPKVFGTLNLDEASAEIDLDFFVLFSSLSARFGNLGQCDYASANVFLDAFSVYRNILLKNGQRRGKTLAIQWPLWKEGGMQVGSSAKDHIIQQFSSEIITQEEGIQALLNALALNSDIISIQKPLNISVKKGGVASLKIANKDSSDLNQKAQDYLKSVLANVLKSEASAIKIEDPFENYGIDSVMILELNSLLEKDFPHLPKTLFFEYNNLSELAKYFLSEQTEGLNKLFNQVESTEKKGQESNQAIEDKVRISEKNIDDIAIIGLSGLYPQSKSLDQFWENLKNSRDCVTEIPKSRWNHDLYFNEDRNSKDGTYGKWGAFLEDFDKFDPLFFNISPKEAELMDPQERLFLETAWSALEDSGYTPQILGPKVGVFVGVMYGQYQLYGVERSIRGEQDLTPESLYASIANRVSYFCNFNGPSLAVDTMCSSSLTALHLACGSVLKDECDAAIIGGVNISSHPNKYLFLGQSQFLSSDGKCRSFAEGGDGYVPGEGVGAILIKPLKKALKDGDHIYAVIKASALNHGGKTHGYTVPNPSAQAALISAAIKKAGINPRTISYLESHGTGTSLGDPIEIRGLSKAFAEFTSDKQFCPIGSVKSNMGHLESAAGMVALTKVLLQIRHKTLVPSIHSEKLNPNIDFTQTPFYVQQSLEKWDAPFPRRVGISSFGAGGSNAHVIIEEPPIIENVRGDRAAYYLFTFSAKQEGVLRQKLEDFLAYLESPLNQGISFPDISFTLNIGRVHHSYRWALISKNLLDLKESIRKVLAGDKIENFFESTSVSVSKNEDDQNYQNALKNLNYESLGVLAELYTRGYSIEWGMLYNHEKRKRISLPTYPFLKERYWIEVPNSIQLASAESLALHPLIDKNISTFQFQEFEKHLDSHSFYLKDHKIKGQLLFPGTAYLELTCAAGFLSANQEVQNIQELFWIRPLVMDMPQKILKIRLKPVESEVGFEVYSSSSSEEVIHAKGKFNFAAEKRPEALNFLDIQSRCGWKVEKDWIYKRYRELGYDYGSSFQNTQILWGGKSEALAKLQISEELASHFAKYTLHPALMDSALRVCFGISGKLNEEFDLAIPFYLEKISIFEKIPAASWVYAKNSKEGYYDIFISDESGKVCAALYGFNVRVYEGQGSKNLPIMAYRPKWEAQAFSVSKSEFPSLILLLTDDPSLSLKSSSCEVIQLLLSDHYEKKDPFNYCVRVDEFNDYKKVYQEVSEKFRDSIHILHLSSEKNFIAQRILSVYPLLSMFKAISENKKSWPIHYLYAYRTGIDVEQSINEAMGSFSNVIKFINPFFTLKTVEFPIEVKWDLDILLPELIEGISERIRYENNLRYIRKWSEVVITKNLQHLPLKKEGVYLITGGLGGLGQIFAEFLKNEYQAKLVLTGRSPLTEEFQNKVAHFGPDSIYFSCNISNEASVDQLFHIIKKQYGQLDGIIHSAGIIGKKSILDVSFSEFEEDYSAKILGTYYLDYFSQNHNLDFFVTFSSISGYLGDYGVGSYAFGNAFMDAFMLWREEARNLKKRSGLSISIAWPYWEEGGMSLSADELAIYKDYSGLGLLPTTEGLKYFLSALDLKQPNLMIMPGDRNKIENLLGIKSIKKSVAILEKNPSPEKFDQRIVEHLKRILSEEIKLPIQRIDENEEISNYGVDSIIIISINQRLAQDFPDIRKTLLFEHKTLKSLAHYLEESYPEAIAKIHGEDVLETHISLEASAPEELVNEPFLTNRFINSVSDKKELHVYSIEPIAIIGVSGRYPEAENLEQFWENLKEGKDCVVEIPSERWDYRPYFNPDKSVPGKTCSKWGGFIKDADKFDPLYFNISPREAEVMDPQERLMLETALNAIEDAGYSIELLKEKSNGSVGVFVGLMWNEYQLINSYQATNPDMLYGSSNNSAIANRISFAFDFHGPSLLIDTACSSSLVAIHLACENIRSGACDYAVAGGVNLSLHPSKYVNMSNLGMLSTDGRCRSFGEGGDGYVPGEGVGALLLKPLSKAIQDKDAIYAVIIGNGANHGGKANGFMVPNPEAQSQLIKQVLKKFKIDPRSIQYVEAHGTGTPLGDPIEITGLTKAFSEFTTDQQFCRIGSVKSNVGHLESAAGIVAVSKTLLQLKNKQFVPSLHSNKLNSFIDFQKTPFKVQQDLEAWSKSEGPRRAGISSFGATGSNAHIILEEAPVQSISNNILKPEYLVAISAKSQYSLKKKFSDLLNYLKKEGISDQIFLSDIAFTLNIGRDHFALRSAFVVDSKEALQKTLEKILEGHDPENYFFADISGQKPEDNDIYLEVLQKAYEKLNMAQDLVSYQKQLRLLAGFYIKGFSLDWKLLHQNESHQRLHLPTYPFLKTRCWIAKAFFDYKIKDSVLAPLLDTNISTLQEQCFRKTFIGNEFYLEDHQIDGQKMLPAAVYLEMALEAAILSSPSKAVMGLKNILWARPLVVDDSASSVQISLSTTISDIAFDIKEGELNNVRGFVDLEDDEIPQKLNMSSFERSFASQIDRKNFYEKLSKKGFVYGPRMQSVDWIHFNDEEAFVRLQLPDLNMGADFYLNPSLLDSALQSTLVFGLENRDEISLPSTLERMHYFAPLPAICFAYILRKTSGFDITLMDEDGKILLILKGCATRRKNKFRESDGQNNFYHSEWIFSELKSSGKFDFNQLIVFDNDDSRIFQLHELLKDRGLEKEIIQVKSGLRYEEISNSQYIIDPGDQDHINILLDDFEKSRIKANCFVNLWLLAEEGDKNNALSRGVLTHFSLSQALMKRRVRGQIQLMNVYFEGDAFGFMITAFAKSLRRENPNFHLKNLCLGVEERHSPNKFAEIFCNEITNFEDIAVRYERNLRQVESISRMKLSDYDFSKVSVRDAGVYIITGGFGGLGLILAEYLLEKYKAKIILTARSDLNTERTQKLLYLQKLGGSAIFVRADISLEDEVIELVKKAKLEFGQIHGVFHCAGIIRDHYILNKKRNEFIDVLSPKVFGTMNLDKALANEPIELFVLFSSVAGMFGNIGQSDYASANAFMDYFVKWGSNRVLQNNGTRLNISINWPLWKEGGMQVGAEGEAFLRNQFGMQPLPTKEGLKALEQVLINKIMNVGVLFGDPSIIAEKLSVKLLASDNDSLINSLVSSDLFIAQNTEEFLKSVISESLKIPIEDLNKDIPFQNYGIDSIAVLDITRRLESKLGPVVKTIFFENRDIRELTNYFIENYRTELDKLFHLVDGKSSKESFVSATQQKTQSLNANGRFLPSEISEQNTSDISEDIAIVGISGRYPGAQGLPEFWQNLLSGKDCITEIPADHWDYAQFYDPDRKAINRSYSKWGGFIHDHDKFDPLFFNIPPSEAEKMDPQERVFLEIAWSALEDAGYVPGKNRDRVGVFVGVMYGDYQLYSSERALKGNSAATYSSFASIANRVSYFCNFSGPSLALDTMCSSSLTALHLACESIQKGECHSALVGGVNISSHPNKYLFLSQSQFLSSDGRCRSFGHGGDGYVPGEGVGAVLLKPLSQAILDRNIIYGVIKGTAINHGGSANAYTVPNPLAQAEVILEALHKAKMDPRNIQYIETHGTGTALGDPIEIRGLTKAFQGFSSDKQFCAIGSVKSNIGHLESAAGMAALTKVLLQFKYKKLVPSLHSDILNPNIDFSKTPFYVQKELSDWKVEDDVSLCSGISSFGAGGSNAHIIVQEAPVLSSIKSLKKPFYLLTLSAKCEESFKKKISDLTNWLKHNENSNIDLSNIAYTLNVGRSQFSVRCAMVVDSITSLLETLTAVLEKNEHQNYVYNDITGLRLEDSEIYYDILERTQEKLLNSESHNSVQYEKNLRILANLFVKGFSPDWKLLHQNEAQQYVSLPAYPFLREKYWVSTNLNLENKGLNFALSPLLDRNVSTLEEQSFSKILNGKEFYFEDHVVNSKKILPAAVYLEIALQAGVLSMRSKKLSSLKNVFWLRPLYANDSESKIIVSIIPNEEKTLFEVRGENSDSIKNVYSQGEISYEEISQEKISFDIQRLQAQFYSEIHKSEFYEKLKILGFEYGPRMQTVQWIKYNHKEVLAKLSLPISLTTGGYFMHPSLLDGALQSVLILGFNDSKTQHLPFSLDGLHFFDALPSSCYVYILAREKETINSDLYVDIRILNELGEVLVLLEGALARPYGSVLGFYQSEWWASALDSEVKQDFSDVIVFDNSDARFSEFKQKLKNGNSRRIVQVKSGNHYEIKHQLSYMANLESSDNYLTLFNELEKQEISRNCFILTSSLNFSFEDLDNRIPTVITEFFIFVQSLMKAKVVGILRLIYCYRSGDPLGQALLGFSRTLHRENPNYQLKVLGIPADTPAGEVANIILNEIQYFNLKDILVEYRERSRWCEIFKPYSVDKSIDSILRNKGVYLITGGLGGLGLLVAEYLAKNYQARLIISGRSPLDPINIEKITALKNLGSEVVYVQGDVAKKDDATQLISAAKMAFGALHGIIHSAGVILDDYLIHKPLENFNKVIAPKILGAKNLDEATRDETLDLFVLFSSIAGSLGNLGQSDYAFGNAFLDHFAKWRDEKVKSKNRSGKTLSIAWPYWADGGMKINLEAQAYLKEVFGLEALTAEKGLEAFESAINSQPSQLGVLYGNYKRAMQSMLETPENGGGARIISRNINIPSDLLEKIENLLRELISASLKVPLEKLRSDVSFQNYGIDSIAVLDLSRRLESKFGDLPKTLFFENRDIRELSNYFLENYSDKLENMFSIKKVESMPLTVKAENLKPHKSRGIDKSELESQTLENNHEDIAIVGLSGRYPMSSSLSEFWENLVDGKDCITEIPKDRWDFTQYFDPDKKALYRAYGKWGGFIKDHDKFDPLFFNISASEAERMDPQERLFLEVVWATLEDAGYVPQREDDAVGVFVGIMYAEYQLYSANDALNGKAPATYSSYASIANRVSYFCNFSGPSVALDTMCSSSLTALHLACDSIRKGDCHSAIVGGVNIASHPNKYLVLSQSQFLSTDGRCRSFGEGGDGYVPGEGVGALLLKPLSKAIADRNTIYGVIKSTAINHGGATNAYTVPNPIAQSKVILHALNKAKINPRTVQYIETHGTGTALGDPIEIRGLSKAFNEFTSATQFCAIGSVKSNIGHLESAAGIAAITKVLLQLKYKKLVPSLHSEILNPHIDFLSTPFFVQKELSDWNIIEGNVRRAGISSFGAGGSNAHVIIQEAPAQPKSAVAEKPYYLLTLSAKNEDSFKRRITDLIAWLSKEENKLTSLSDISYTLNVGRVHFNYRLGLVANSLIELNELLGHAKNHINDSRCYLGVVDDSPIVDAPIYRKIFLEVMQELTSESPLEPKLYRENLEVLANFYVKGYSIDWELLHQKESRRRVSLPTYPFLRERYWIKSVIENSPVASSDILNYESGLASLDKNLHKNYYFEGWFPRQLNFKPGSLVAREHWILFSNKKAISTEIISMLNKRKCEVTLVYAGEDFQKLQQHYQVNPTSVFDIERVFDEINMPIHGIIHAWSDNINSIYSAQELIEAQELICASSLHLIQIIARRQLKTRIFFILNGVYEVPLAPIPHSIHSVAQAPLLGLAKSILVKNPKIKGHIIDLDPNCEMVVAADQILQVIMSDGSEPINVFRSEKFFVPRMQEIASFSSGSKAYFSAGKNYLISGDVHILQKSNIDAIREQGVQNIILVCNHTIKEDLRKKLDFPSDIEFLVLEGNKNQMPDISGIIHLVSHEEVNDIREIAWNDFSSILSKKISDIWQMQSLVLKKTAPLDFIMLYSISKKDEKSHVFQSVINLFLDAWASYQRQQRIPVYSIHLSGDSTGFELFGTLLQQKIPQITISSDVEIKEEFDEISLRKRINKVLYKILPIQAELQLGDDSDFFDLGMESIRALEFSRELQNEFKIKLSDTFIFDHPKIGSLINYLSKNLKHSSKKFVEYLKPKIRARIFCFPYAAGTRKIFSGWSQILPKELEVYPIDYTVYAQDGFPQRIKTVQEVVADLIKNLPWDKPFFFFGTSLGAIISWELSQQLMREGKPVPRHLFVAACAAPHLYPITMRDSIDLLNRYRIDAGLKPFDRKVDAHYWSEIMRQEIEKEGADIFLQSLEGIGFRDISSLASDPAVFEAFYPRALADMCLSLDYSSSDPEMLHSLSCPITAFEGQEDPLIRPNFVRSWQFYTKKKFEFIKLNSDHFFIYDCKDDILNKIKSAYEANFSLSLEEDGLLT